jgi:O-antigen ligase
VKRLICIGNLAGGVILMLMTGSRGGIVGFLVVLFMLLVTKTHTIRMNYKLIFVGLCSVFVFLNASKINLERFETLLNLDEDYNVTGETGRLEIWKAGLRLMLNRPFTGVGVNCFPEAIGTVRDERGSIPVWQTAHNSLIQIGTETGIIGFLLFAVMSFKAFRIFGRMRKQGQSRELIKIGEMARIGFMGHFITAMFLSQAYSIYWGFYMALSAVLSSLMSEESKAQ